MLFDFEPEFPARSGLLSRLFQTVHLHPAETFCRYPSRAARTVAATSEWFEIFFVFRSLDRQPRKLSCPSDDLKLLLGNESRKGSAAELSTLSNIRCGHEWKTQRFTASLPVPLGQQPQTQRIQPDEAFRVLLVVGTGIVFKRDVAFRIQRVG